MERASGTAPSPRGSSWSCGSKESSSTSPRWISRGESHTRYHPLLVFPPLPCSPVIGCQTRIFLFFFLWLFLQFFLGDSIPLWSSPTSNTLRCFPTAYLVFPWPYPRLEKIREKINIQTLERLFGVLHSTYFLPRSRWAACFFFFLTTGIKKQLSPAILTAI